MIKLMKYLKKSAGYVALIIALLFLQAYCDLSLPDYTSKIVNIGIQQKGIEDGVPEKIRKTSMDALELFMSQEDISQLETAYTEDGELYVLKDIDKDTRASLNEILGKPMLMLGGLTMENEASGEMLAQMGIPEGADPVEAHCTDAGGCESADDREHGRKIPGHAGFYDNPGGGFLCSGRV